MSRVVVFGGTSDGRRLAGELARRGGEVTLCTATPYGGELAGERPGLALRVGRMDAAEMGAFLAECRDALVVDATHPYAKEATANIRTACGALGLDCLRLRRGSAGAAGDAVVVDDVEGAVDFLAAKPGAALLTVGSKELAAFCRVADFRERFTARVLPANQVLAHCLALGFPPSRLILMQGPFTRELNAATLRQVGARWLVTKDSGPEGGVEEKLAAAGDVGAGVVLIRRPQEREGAMFYGELLGVLCARLGLAEDNADAAPAAAYPRFPAFLDIAGKTVLIVGGGAVAARRAGVLLRFGARVRLVAPRLEPGLAALAVEGRVCWEQRPYGPGDLEGAALVVAATGDRTVNAAVARAAKAAGVPVSVADHREEGSFWFPAVVEQSGLTAGIASAAGDHKAVARAAALLRRAWGAEL